MAEASNILVGTVGQGVMRSADGGDSWRRVGLDQGLHSDAMVRTLASHPKLPQVVYAGTDKGLYRSDDVGEHWALVDSALSDYTVWALAIDAEEPDRMYAGTGTPTPATIFRTIDGGKTWAKPTFPIWLNIPLSKSSAFFKPLSICETLAVGMAIITP